MIMDYEKKYKESMAKMSTFLAKHDGFTISKDGEMYKELSEIFPELKESEGKDEKIRKALIRAFKSLNTIKVWNGIERTDIIDWLEKQGNLMKALQISNARIGELIEKNYYLKEQLEKQGNNMGISEATKQKLDDNLNKALEKETPESWNKFLDEQGEQKPVFEMKTPEESLGIDSDTYNKIVDECIYGEQKFKIEEGKWYVCTQTYVLRGKIVVIKGQTYQAEKDNAIKGGDECLFIDKHDGKASEYFRLWTIQDAKDGDVLFQDLMGGKTFIYNGVNSNMAILYSFIISNDGEDILPYNIGKPNTGIGNIEENKNIIHPATKEQRNLLFQKMKESGYEWDAEKKELKKIEQKPAAWSEEELDSITAAINNLEYFKNNCVYHPMGLEPAITFLKSLKDRVQPQKQEWSDVDKDILFRTINNLKFLRDTISIDPKYAVNIIDIEREITWLKSIKDRVLPQPKQEWSEEDNRMCKVIIDNIKAICEEGYFVGNIDSDELIKWLKSLKERYTWKPNSELDEASYQVGIKRVLENPESYGLTKCDWKPSDEQMDALRYVTNFDYGGYKATLVSLYEQLKKLRGE